MQITENIIFKCADFSCDHCLSDSYQPSALTTDQASVYTHRLSRHSWPQKAIQTKKELMITSVCGDRSYDTGGSRVGTTSAPAQMPCTAAWLGTHSGLDRVGITVLVASDGGWTVLQF